MRKYISFFALLLLSTVALFAQTHQTKPSVKPTGQQAKTFAKKVTAEEVASISRPHGSAGWSNSDRASFLNSCMAKISWGRDSSLAYCSCMLQKVEARYALPADASNLSQDTVTLWAKQCLSGGKVVVWNAAYRKSFLDNCEQSFLKTAGVTRTKAVSYCSCMLKKVEATYPNPLDASKMDQEKIRNWAVDCLKE